MPTDECLAKLVRYRWLAEGPLSGVVSHYTEALRSRRYTERTILAYLGCLAHFSYWMTGERIELSSVDPSVVNSFLAGHLPACTCPAPCYGGARSSGAALRHLLRLLPTGGAAVAAVNPVEGELERYGEYLSSVCGVAPSTREGRTRHVGMFLIRVFDTGNPALSQLTAEQVDTFLCELTEHWRPASLRTFCNSLRSYVRYRALLGDPATALLDVLPRVADWRLATLPKALSDTELEAFLAAFDRTDPVGLRDYAIARCLLDLGLRGYEVTYLTLESVDWRSATVTISASKSKRAQQLPLPVPAGEAIAQYLRQGRPKTKNRRLFVRHRAPFGEPLSVAAIRNAMNRAFTRCGLRERFCNTHVLRRTTATRLQRSGASVKEIADLLRHRGLDTASRYVRVDLERLRTVALPWPGSRP